MREPTVTAAIVTASEEFLEATTGMSAEERVDFMVGFWFGLDHYPDQDYESFLPIWKRWKERKQHGKTA